MSNKGDSELRYRSLDTNLLVMLDILLDTTSITQTGEIMGLTQPTISSALGRLRQHFGDELLVTAGRNNVPTPLGRRLRDPLKELLARTDALISLRSGFDPATDTRRFSVLASDYVTATFGIELIRSVTTAGPSLAVELDTIRPGSLPRFERGEIDIAIVPQYIAFADHPHLTLYNEDYVAVSWTGNQEVGERMTEQDFLSARHVSYKSWQTRRPYFEECLVERGVKRNVAVEAPSFTQQAELVPGTPFLATIHRRLATKLAKRLPLRILELPFELPKLPIIMQWHCHLDNDLGIQWFKDLTSALIDAENASAA